jgi:uncharacterized protein YbjT (DUF2867 family)
MEEKKILVLGGKGKTGGRVVERLTKLGKTIRIGSRSEKPSFDWENKETWEGKPKIFLTMLERQLQLEYGIREIFRKNL